MINSIGRLTEGPYSGLPVGDVPTQYLDFLNRTRPLPWAATVTIGDELSRRRVSRPACPICGYALPRNRFAVGKARARR